MEVTEQLAGLDFLLSPYGYQESNSDHQALWQVPLATEASFRP